MRIQFTQIDTDGNGLLSPDELVHFAKIANIDPSFVNLAFLIFDGDEKGGLTFEEFVDFMNISRNFDSDRRTFLRRLFQAVDKDNNGTIDGAELQKLAEVLGDPMTLKEANQVIKSLDSTGTGKLTFVNFCHWFRPPQQK
jgi:Ca2+-binding EF-hand superfamily protein